MSELKEKIKKMQESIRKKERKIKLKEGKINEHKHDIEALKYDIKETQSKIKSGIVELNNFIKKEIGIIATVNINIGMQRADWGSDYKWEPSGDDTIYINIEKNGKTIFDEEFYDSKDALLAINKLNINKLFATISIEETYPMEGADETYSNSFVLTKKQLMNKIDRYYDGNWP